MEPDGAMGQLTEWLQLMLAEIANRQQAALADQEESTRRRSSTDDHACAEVQSHAAADVGGHAGEAAHTRRRVSAE